ncbi:hypothetical protein FHR70_004038 [Microvirga lupini]|uniref:DUF6894 domain-containing protein n=1 Tax=Microvirga lupini TaxID=420324 RepID=A0A7W4VPG9_9HYPH|nr:hypothetical protein [Microvirga lupini]MBB3020950.1 hypothetical protein [Microvirga lupini]
MPRFYFDIQKGTELIPDADGLEIDSLEAAEKEATQAAIELGRAWLPFARQVQVRVRDEQGWCRLSLSIALTVERMG